MAMKQLNLDLGYTDADKYGDMSQPYDPEKEKDKVRYPSFTYSDDDDDLASIPLEGKMLIEYCISSRVKMEKEDEETYTCTVEVKKIIGVEGEKDERPAKTDSSTSDALDKIAEALEAANKES